MSERSAAGEPRERVRHDLPIRTRRDRRKLVSHAMSWLVLAALLPTALAAGLLALVANDFDVVRVAVLAVGPGPSWLLLGGLLAAVLLPACRLRATLKPLDRIIARTRALTTAARGPEAEPYPDELRELEAALDGIDQRSRQQIETLAAFAEIDRLILASRDTENALDAVLRRIAAVVPGCELGVLLVNRDEPGLGHLFCRSAVRRLRDGVVKVAISNELRAWLVRQPAGGLHDVAEIRSRLREYTVEGGGGIGFVMPILHDGELQGALLACFDSPAAARNANLESLREFAVRCAVAICVAEREQVLLQRACYDPVTGLPNRQLCYDRLRQALAAARREDQKVGVLFIDLDGFKSVNDSMGHASGDELLRETGLRLSAALRATDTVARLGGDEYVVILPRVHGALEVEVIVGSIMDALKWPFHIHGQTACVSASIGVALFPDDASTAEELLRRADTAMYNAKDSGRSRHVFFAKEMDDRARQRLMLYTNLRSAVANGELFLLYQPQVDLASGRVVCAEALLRWRHPDHGPVPIETFLPVLEETELVESIGGWVLRQALNTFASWRREGLAIERVAVNAAMRQLFGEGLSELVKACLEEFELPGRCLEIELTESALVTNFVRSNEVLKTLAAREVRIAIDDFGTGYSSLGYLKDLTFDVVKIDRAFIGALPDDKSLAIVKAVLDVAHSLNKDVVAEGIETELQHAELAKLNCDIGQGFLFGRPMTAPAFRKWLGAVEATNLLDEAFAFGAGGTRLQLSGYRARIAKTTAG